MDMRQIFYGVFAVMALVLASYLLITMLLDFLRKYDADVVDVDILAEDADRFQHEQKLRARDAMCSHADITAGVDFDRDDGTFTPAPADLTEEEQRFWNGAYARAKERLYRSQGEMA